MFAPPHLPMFIHLLLADMSTPEVQNAGGIFWAGTFIVSAVKVFTSPRIISPMLPIIILECGRFRTVKCGRAGDVAKIPKFPTKCRRVGISVLVISTKMVPSLISIKCKLINYNLYENKRNDHPLQTVRDEN